MNAHTRDTASEASLLQCGFRIGYFSRTDIEHWAEKQIEQADLPSMDLIELAILRGKNDWDIVSLLSRLGSEFGPRARMELTIGMIGKLYRMGKASLESSVHALFWLILENDYEPSKKEIGEIYSLDDAYDLAMNGTYGNIEAVKSSFLSFTEPYVTVVADKELGRE